MLTELIHITGYKILTTVWDAIKREVSQSFQKHTTWPNLSQTNPEPMPSTFTASSSTTGCPTTLVPRVCTL
jgi:hypothetical protein